MKKIICFITLLLLSNICLAAGSSDNGDSKDSLYKGNISIFGRKSNKNIYSMKKSSFETGKIFSKKHVENFIKIEAKKLRK